MPYVLPIMPFEYKTIDRYALSDLGGGGAAGLSAGLNRLGGDGWQLAAVLPDADPKAAVFVFMRTPPAPAIDYRVHMTHADVARIKVAPLANAEAKPIL